MYVFLSNGSFMTKCILFVVEKAQQIWTLSRLSSWSFQKLSFKNLQKFEKFHKQSFLAGAVLRSL